MGDVQRYRLDSFGRMTTEPDGEWVQFAAYDALARQLAAMTALHLDTCGDLRVAEAELAEARQRLAAKETILLDREQRYRTTQDANVRLTARLHAEQGLTRAVEKLKAEQEIRSEQAEARLAEVMASLEQLVAAKRGVDEARYQETGYRKAGDEMDTAWKQAATVLARARV